MRAYTGQGDIYAKDPYRPLYRRLLAGLEELAATSPRTTPKTTISP